MPTRWQSWRAASGESRKARVSAADRAGSLNRLRTLSSPRSGSGLSDEPAEQQRQDLLHEPRRPGEAAGQLADGCPGAQAVGEPERAQPGVDRARSAEQLLVLGRERLEQRTEVQPLVDGSHRDLDLREGGVELVQGTALGGVPEAERAGDPGSFGGGDGHRVHLGAVPQLQPMLQAAQEAVGVGQLPGVVVVDVARRPELGQDGERRRRPQIGIESAVHELEQLHGELDVADAAPAALHLAVGEPAARQLDPRSGP